MKKFFSIILFFILAFSTAEKAFSISELKNCEDTMIVLLKLKDAKTSLVKKYDFEVATGKKGFLLPIKDLGVLLDCEVSQNHLNGNIKLITKQGEIIEVQPQEKKILSKKYNYTNIEFVYVKQGLLDEVQDDIFIPAKIAQEILGIDIIENKNAYSLDIHVPYQVRALQEITLSDEDISNAKKGYLNLCLPDEKKKFSLEKISINNRFYNDSNMQKSQKLSQRSTTSNNNSDIMLQGSVLKGDYTINLDANTYKGEGFSFGGIGLNYKEKRRGYDYQFGRLLGVKEDAFLDYQGINGFQVDNFSTQLSSYREISGKVTSGSTIDVYINNTFLDKVSTYDGYYSLEDLPYFKDKVKQIRLEEIFENGDKKLIKEYTFPKLKNFLAKGDSRHGFLAGVSGYGNKFFNQNGYIYETTSKKFATGGLYSYGLSDNLKLNTSLMVDNIISKSNEQHSWFIDDATQNQVLNLSTFKNFNQVDGQTLNTSIDYALNPKYSFSANAGISNAKDYDNILEHNIGSALSLEAKRKGENNNLRLRLFDYSPSFYMAGTDGGTSTYSDKKGISIGTDIELYGSHICSNLSNYYSNLDNSRGFGKIKYNDASLSITKNFKNGLNFLANTQGQKGANDLGKIINYSYNFDLRKKVTPKVELYTQKKLNRYKTNYNIVGSQENNFSSTFDDLDVGINWRPKGNRGEIRVSHDILGAKTGSTYENNYKALRLGYELPRIGNFVISFNGGHRYDALNNGVDFSTNLSYIFPSQRRLTLSYHYNRLAGAFFDNIFLPSNSRHCFYLDFTDTLTMIGGKLKSLRSTGNNYGYLELSAFLDINKNGIKDENEPTVPNIGIKQNWLSNTVYTNKNGKCEIQSIPEGVYKVWVDYDELPSLLSISPKGKKEYMVKVNKKQKTRAEFALLSSAGSVSGKIKILDETKKEMNIPDLIMVLLDMKGNEVAYTNVDKNKNFYISGITPGKYQLKLDDNFLKRYSLKGSKSKGVYTLEIPPVYDDYVDIKDVELNYIKNYENI